MTLASEAMKLSVAYKMLPTNELATYGVHTGKREDPSDVEECMNILENWHRTQVMNVMPSNVLVEVAASYWATAGGFTGWHRFRSYLLSATVGSGNSLPHQCAAVVGYRTNASLLFSIPAGRKRNRSYIGPLRTTVLDTVGELTSNVQLQLSGYMETLHDSLHAVPVPEFNYAGLLVVSPTQEQCYGATQVSVGRAVDTMRSRRSSTNEEPVYTDLDP